MLKNLDSMKRELRFRGAGNDGSQHTRLREDKLKTLKCALYNSYQASVVQKCDLSGDVEKLKSIYTKLLNQQELTAEEDKLLTAFDFSPAKIKQLQEYLKSEEGYFRCLINHDKLKTSYEDKIISIPFEECTVNIDNNKDNDDLVETNFTNGTVFKWVHGNKEKWVPDTYWIVYLQYSEEIAYFRGEIRKADNEIEIVTEDGSKLTYRGWMTGPEQTSVMWNVKKNLAWNDLNYTKILYITKDKKTQAFFQRFDRVMIDGKPWEVQAFNDNFGNTPKHQRGGIIRVALKETYTDTMQAIKESKEKEAAAAGTLAGPTTLSSGDNATYESSFDQVKWNVFLKGNSRKTIEDLVSIESQGSILKLKVKTRTSFPPGIYISDGHDEIHVKIL